MLYLRITFLFHIPSITLDSPDVYLFCLIGYGHMTTKDGFEMSGYFRDGKAKGPGRFTAPNGERFCGVWNKNSKRHGRGILVKAPAEDGSDGGVRKQLIEIYDDGKLLKRMNATGAPASATHWLPCAPAEYGSATPYVFPDAAPLTRRGMRYDIINRNNALSSIAPTNLPS